MARPARPSRIPPGVSLLCRWRLWVHELRRGRLSPDKLLGFVGEDAAGRFLRRAGFQLLARNVVTPQGEADLVCRAPDGKTFVIVEVKTRRVSARTLGERPGAAAPAGSVSQMRYPPESAVHFEKRRKLVAIARHLAALNHWGDAPVRIDVVAIEWPEAEAPGRAVRPEIRHWVDAVR